jgi:hypothetical protein
MNDGTQHTIKAGDSDLLQTSGSIENVSQYFAPGCFLAGIQ